MGDGRCEAGVGWIMGLLAINVNVNIISSKIVNKVVRFGVRDATRL